MPFPVAYGVVIISIESIISKAVETYLAERRVLEKETQISGLSNQEEPTREISESESFATPQIDRNLSSSVELVGLSSDGALPGSTAEEGDKEVGKDLEKKDSEKGSKDKAVGRKGSEKKLEGEDGAVEKKASEEKEPGLAENERVTSGAGGDLVPAMSQDQLLLVIFHILFQHQYLSSFLRPCPFLRLVLVTGPAWAQGLHCNGQWRSTG